MYADIVFISAGILRFVATQSRTVIAIASTVTTGSVIISVATNSA